MTHSSESSFFTDVTWSAKTLNLSISRFFTTIKSGLGTSSNAVHQQVTWNRHAGPTPLLTWDQIRDNFNVISPANPEQKYEKEQYRLLKDTVTSVYKDVNGLQPAKLQHNLENPQERKINNCSRGKKDISFPQCRGVLKRLDEHYPESFRKEFYKVPPPVYVEIPDENGADDYDDRAYLISVAVRKFKKIPPWECRKILPHVEGDFFDTFKLLEKKVIEFQKSYDEVRNVLHPLCELIRTKQLNTGVYFKHCQLLWKESLHLRECLDHCHTLSYDNYFSFPTSQIDRYTISEAARNHGILMQLLFDIQRALPVAEDRLTRCKETMLMIKSTMNLGAATFQAFKAVHGRYVCNDSLLERYFWRLWWHFDIIQQELYAGGVRDALQQHQTVLAQSIADVREGKLLLGKSESTLRGIRQLISLIESTHETRLSVQNALKLLDEHS